MTTNEPTKPKRFCYVHGDLVDGRCPNCDALQQPSPAPEQETDQSPPVEQKELPPRVSITTKGEPAAIFYHDRTCFIPPGLPVYVSEEEATAREAALRELLKKAEEALEWYAKGNGVGWDFDQVVSVKDGKERVVAGPSGRRAREALAAIRAGREGDGK